jgi:hypothetical protein
MSIQNLLNSKKSVYMNRNGGESNKLFKYIGGDSIVYKDIYVEDGSAVDYYGKISCDYHTLSISSETINISGSISNLTLSGDTTVNNLTVSGDTTVNNLTVSGDTTVNNLTVSGNIGVLNKGFLYTPHQFQALGERRVNITIPGGISGSSVGGVLAPSGKIYCGNPTHTYVLIIDTNTDTLDTTSISGVPSGYAAGVLAPNGKIFFYPDKGTVTDIMVIDPFTDTVQFYPIPGRQASNTKVDEFGGAVLAPNGKIYIIPRKSSYFIVIDPDNPANADINVPNLSGLGTADKYFGGVLSTDGNIYCVPSGATRVLKVNIFTNPPTVNQIGSTYSNQELKWATGALAQDGKIYCAPWWKAEVLVINPSDDTTSLLATGMGDGSPFGKFFSTTLALDGRVYMLPFNAGHVAMITPGTTPSYTQIINLYPLYAALFLGSVLSPKGHIYGIPLHATYVTRFRPTGLPILPSWPLEAYFNKL